MLKKWEVVLPGLTGKRARNAYIWLPDCYDEDEVRRYPVLYLFDGHNTFVDGEATYGKSWGLASYLTWTKKPLIVVGVECNTRGNGRLREYSPVSFSDEKYGNVRGQGRKYMQWLVEELKPYIDENYRTMADREHTYVAGSSMGGLMSVYASTVYNGVFSRAACLSPSLWVQPEKIRDMVAKSDIGGDTVIYMDYGSEELSNHGEMMEHLTAMAALLLEKGVNLTFRIVPGGDHSEASWERQVPVFMECLGI